MTSRLILRITGFILLILTGYPQLKLAMFQWFQEPRRYHYYYSSPSAGFGEFLSVLKPILLLSLVMVGFSFYPRTKVGLEKWITRIVGISIFIMPFVPALSLSSSSWTFYTPYSSIEAAPSYSLTTGSIAVHLLGLIVLGLGFIGRKDSPLVVPSSASEAEII